MNGRPRLIAIALLLACAAPANSQTAAPSDQKASFTMNISLMAETVKPGSEVFIIVDLTNTSAKPITLWRPRTGPPVYIAEVLDRAGKPAPLTAMGRAFQKGDRTYIPEKGGPMRSLGAGTGSSLRIEPGETIKDAVAIQRQVDLSRPGEYKIRLERTDPTTKVLVKSNAVTLTVTN